MFSSVFDDKDTQAMMIQIAFRGQLDQMRWLFSMDSEIFYRNVDEGEESTDASPLWIAAQFGYLELARWLVEMGRAAVDMATNVRVNALDIKSQQGHLEIFRLLVEKGDDVNRAENVKGIPPLSIGCHFGYLEVVRILVEEGNADVNHAALNEFAPLEFASYMGKEDVCRYLRSKGAGT